MINNQDSHSQRENNETTWAKYPNEIDSEVSETNKTYEIPNFMPKILSEDEIAEGINSLNSKQGEFFDVVNKWAKDYVKDNEHNIKTVYIFQCKNLAFFHLDLHEYQQ